MEEPSNSAQITHTGEALQTTDDSQPSPDLRNICEHDTPNPKKKPKKNPMKKCRTPINAPINNINAQDPNNSTHNNNSNTHNHNITTQNPNKNTQSPNSDNHNGNTESLNKNTNNQNSNTHNNFINQFLENNQHLGDATSTGRGRGRSKKSTISKIQNESLLKTDATVAQSVGFPVDSLTEEEIESGVVSTVGGAEQASYVNIRNQIIRLWRSNVNASLSKDQVMASIPGKNSLVSSAYNFLLSHGYINFGVSPAIKSMIPHEATKGNVVIIGAGLAGLAAARQLLSFGFKVVIVEGRKRPGGRVYTKKMEVAPTFAAADLGGSVLTGTHGNPLGVLASQLAYPLHKIRDKCSLYGPDGSPVNAEVDSRIEEAFNRLLDKAGQLRQLMGEVAVDISLGTALETFRKVYGVAEADEEEGMLFNWHLANLEYANAGLLSKLSLAFWDQDDPYEMGGDHCFVPGGNGRLVQALTENLPIFYEKNVNTIRYGSDGVQVLAGGQVFQGDMVLCTVPLGVLKSNTIRFIPELPQRKLDAIKRLGFGLLNKVAMLFPHRFWGAELDTFGHLCTDNARRGEFFLFYSYAAVSGGPLLIALVAGEAAIKFESMPATDAVTRVLEILKGIYAPRGIDVPDPIQTVCTRWGSDPLSLGSYSHVAVGASGDDYDILAESVGEGRLFFAGEATNRRYPATMHGAFLSGLREAANISNVANIRSMPSKVERSLSKDIQSYAALLADLFRHPDLEFGSFSVLFDPQSNDPKSLALLRVMIGGTKRKNNDNAKTEHSNKLIFQQLQSHLNQQLLYLYTLITQQQALELREVRGGDEARLSYLYQKLGVKLVGRRGLGAVGDSLVASIKSARAARRPISAPSPVKFGK